MRFTQRLEVEVLTALVENPDACITFPEKAYRTDGAILIHRQNRSFRLHRYLALQLGLDVPRNIYMHPGCKTPRCVNPFHRELSKRSSVGRNATKCINGHPYTRTNTLASGRYRCRQCRDERNARRRTGPRWGGYCGKGIHRLTPGNVYLSRDVRGKEHRRCRQCTLERMRETRND